MRRSVLVTYLGGVAVVFVFAAGFFLYFSMIDWRGGGNTADPTAVGTSGERMPREGAPGGFDPNPSFSSTQDELEYRGGATGRVELDNVQVERADGDAFWVRDGDRSVAVVAPGGMPTVRSGQRVDVIGTVESNGRIRASRIDVK